MIESLRGSTAIDDVVAAVSPEADGENVDPPFVLLTTFELETRRMLEVLRGSMATALSNNGCDGPVQLAPAFVDLYSPWSLAARIIDGAVLIASDRYTALPRPSVSSLHEAAPSFVLKMWFGQAAYNTELFDGSITSEE